MRLPVVLLLALAACPTPLPKPPATPTELTREDRLAVAQLEVQRDAGVTKLIELADDRMPAKRALAMRALGRVGSPEAVTALRARLVGQEAIVAAAGLGIAGATGAIEPDLARALVGELAAMPVAGRGRVAVIEAIARLGTTAAQAPLARALGADDPQVVMAAGLGLGRLGRAEVALEATTELALLGLLKHPQAGVRYAATYALARAFLPPTQALPAATDPLVRGLRDRLGDGDATVRLAAIAGLAARRAVAVTTPDLLEVLDDGDWRVATELVRALGGAAATDATRAALVPYLARAIQEWGAARLPPPFAHVIMTGLRQLADRATEPAVRALLVSVARGFVDRPPSTRDGDRQLAAAWINCLALSALARPVPTMIAGEALNDPGVAFAQLPRCGDGVLADPLVEGVVLEAAAAGAGIDPVRRIVTALAAADPRVAAAAADQIATITARLSPAERATVQAGLIAALRRQEAAVAGAAADASGAYLAAVGTSGEPAALAAAVLARLDTAVDDAELTASILGAIAAAKLDGLPACERRRRDPSPATRAAARDCVKSLTGNDPGPSAAEGAAPRPPVDPDLALRTTGTWRLTTTAGELVIGLEPTIAPWHVAAIITLTRSGYYDGTVFHRVVPGFVVQGGDPTATGWGGPGFTLPSETTAALEPIPVDYGASAVGIADAGKDTGGSQWFAMHAPAPHLAGRYTWVGRVIEGEDVLARLLIGDRIIRARFE